MLYLAIITLTDGTQQRMLAHLASVDANIKMYVARGMFAGADVTEYTEE